MNRSSTYLRAWRKKRRLTLEKLAERTGMSPGNISLIERARQDYTQSTLEKFAAALECTPADILAFDPSGGPRPQEPIESREADSPPNGLRQARVAAGLSQDALAKRASTTRATIERLETGKSQLTRSGAETFAIALESDPVELLWGAWPVVPVSGVVGKHRNGLVLDEANRTEISVGMWLPRAPSWEALIVRGDGLYPVYREGDVLLFRRGSHDLADLEDEDCIIQLVDGRKVVRSIRQGSAPDKWFLYNDFSAPMKDQDVLWAAPIRLILKFKSVAIGAQLVASLNN